MQAQTTPATEQGLPLRSAPVAGRHVSNWFSFLSAFHAYVQTDAEMAQAQKKKKGNTHANEEG
jgi:hypothetical protein